MSEKLSYKNTTFIGAGRLELPSTECETIPVIEQQGEMSIISVMYITQLYHGKLEKDTPHWWNELYQQVEQVKGMSHPMIIKLPDESYMVVGRYSEKFFQWLGDIPSNGVIYDRDTESIIIDEPTWTMETSQAMTASAVQATTVAAGYIAPETQQSRRLKEDGKQAQKEGYDLPSRDIFPTDRELYKHQEDVVRVLAWRGHGIIADDVGSGKSSMFIEGFFSLVQKRIDDGEDINDCFPLVIVTKSSLVAPIAREAQTWFHTVKVSVAGSKKKTISKDQKNYPMEDAHIIVCPLSATLDKQVNNIIDCEPCGVVFDESHMVKNVSAKRTQAALKLAKWIKDNNDHPYTVCVSATPMPNRPQELWAQLVITGIDEPLMEIANARQKPPFPKRVAPKIRANYTFPVSNQTKFEIRYCKGRPGPFGWDAKGSAHEKELKTVLYDNGFIRRKKSEFITPLPPLHQSFVRCDITDRDKRRYDIAEQEFKDYIVSSMRRKARKEKWNDNELYSVINEKMAKAQHSEAIMKMTAVRQLAGEMKVPGVVDWIHRYFAGDPTIVKNGKHDKLIVFAHHKEVQDKLINHPELKKYGILSIQSGQKNVNSIVDKFQDPSSGHNLIICYSEAREGLTLTAAHAVLVVEMPWSPSWLLQMAGRCWARFSELYPPHEATIFYATADVGIDKYLVDMVRKKGWLSKTIIDPEVAIDAINEGEAEGA